MRTCPIDHFLAEIPCHDMLPAARSLLSAIKRAVSLDLRLCPFAASIKEQQPTPRMRHENQKQISQNY